MDKLDENHGVGSQLTVIGNENALPPGKIISFENDEIALNEKQRKEYLIWDISKGNTKLCWVLSVKNAYGGVHFSQIVKNVEKFGYKIVKKAVIESNVLTALYDKRSVADTQKATSNDSVVIGVFELIATHAFIKNASDIHIEVRPGGCVVRMRIDGELMEYDRDHRMTYNEAFSLCSVMYTVLANTKAVTFQPRDAQQAAIDFSIKEQPVKFRYQSVPAYPEGFDVILRLLPIGKSEDFTPLQRLGYTEQQVEEITNIANRPVGALIIAGVTGSGKSTTLKNLLMYMNANTGYRAKIYTIEDPPEYTIAKVTQIPVVVGKNTEEVSPFETYIKACMRADPDIIMIGEVRDQTTGNLTKKAIQSGHQILSTIHTTSGLGIIERLEDFGLSRSTLGAPDFLTGLIYQKLLGIVCPHCGINFEKYINSEIASEKDLALYKRIAAVVDLKNFPDIRLRNENGCDKCNNSGVKGRSVCAEVIMLNLEMLDLISKGEIIGLIKSWRGLSDQKPESENMRGKTCMEHAFQKMLQGLVCPKSVESSFKPINEMKLETSEKPKKIISKEENLEEYSKSLVQEGWSKL